MSDLERTTIRSNEAAALEIAQEMNALRDQSDTTVAALLADGYREFPPAAIDHYKRLFQKRVTSDEGTLYFVNFREWERTVEKVSFDAEVSCDTATGGTVWITILEDGIRQTELRAAALWAAAGSVYYEKD